MVTSFRRLGDGTALLVGALFCSSLMSAQAGRPDLTLNRARTASTISIEKRTFAVNDCAVIERCVGGSGNRTLLRFDVAVVNVGRSDLILGDPRWRPSLYQFSPCHHHYHFRELISYEVLDSRNRLVFRASKQAFCLRDNFPYLRNAPASRGYDCEFQGLTAGWEDVYDKSLDCQWIDVTGIRQGTYKLRATVNLNLRLGETSYRNNTIIVQFTVPRGRW